MGQLTDQVRAHIGEGELEAAIDQLVAFLKQIGGDLYNQALHQRGLYKSWQRDRMMGVANDPAEKNRIMLAVLNIASQIDKLGMEDPLRREQYKQRWLEDEDDSLNRGEPSPSDLPEPEILDPIPNPPGGQYQAQCFFTGDMMLYYITKDDQILAVNPLTNQRLIVGVKMPSQNFNFAWTFYVNATGIYYLVDHAGIIWGQNFGMPAQVGYVKYFN